MIWIKKSNDNRRRMLKLSVIKEYPEMRYPLKVGDRNKDINKSKKIVK
jgi:hypothetical protein